MKSSGLLQVRVVLSYVERILRYKVAIKIFQPDIEQLAWTCDKTDVG